MDRPTPLHILVIEDDADTRANLRDILDLDDHRIESAGTAAEALARRDWSPIAVVILDRKLPDATADELLPRIRHEAPDADVIIVTGYADLQGAVSALRQGATDYILKPIEPNDLRARLGRIAEGRQARSEVKRQAEIIRSLLASASDAIIVADSRGAVQLSNPAAERLIGPMTGAAPPEEGTQSRWAHRDDAGTTFRPEELPLARALRGEQVVDQEVFVRRPGTDVGRWTSVNASPIDNGGDIKGAVVIYRDISERKRAAEELRLAEERLRLLVQNSSDIITALSGDGTVLYQGPSIERLLGHRPADRVGRNVFDHPIVHPEDLTKKREFLNQAVRRPGVPVAAEFRLRHADGTWRHIEAVGQNLLADPSVGAIVANYRDITERRQAEERALRGERLAAIGQMVAGLAHESRNALQRSQACLEMLALHVRDRPNALGLIARLQKAQDDLHYLYEDVRDYAAPIRLERRRCDLAAVWREAWAHLEPQRSGRSALLRERPGEPEIPCVVDPFRLGQIFHNVFENALAACPDPVEVEVGWTPTEVDGQAAVRVSVRDNGPGLGPEDRRRIFEPFYTTKTRGTGLGMAIARRIIEAHGGRIAAGEGATPGAEIVITLPRGEP